MAFHGYPRYTGDIDFFVRPTKENTSRVVGAIQAFGIPGWEQLFDVVLQKGKIVQIGRPPNRIDIITSVSGVDFDEAWQSGVEGNLDQLPVRFLDFALLLKNKKAAGRTKDLADVEELEKLLKCE